MNRRLSPIFHCLTIALLIGSIAAQQTSKKGPAAGGPTSQASPTIPDPGAITNGVYRNSFFGFTYKLPFGWVDRTEDMREGSSESNQPPEIAASRLQGHAKPLVLLAVFERPPEATGSTINSAVVIAAEPVSSYPGLTDAENYFGPLTELARSRSLNVVNPPYEYHVGAKILMRGDFSKEIGQLTMFQSSLVMMQKRYVASFTFIGGSEDEVDELLRGLSFGASSKSPSSSSQPLKH